MYNHVPIDRPLMKAPILAFYVLATVIEEIGNFQTRNRKVVGTHLPEMGDHSIWIVAHSEWILK